MTLSVVPFDLQQHVPAGWTLRDLSDPRSDGVNRYRLPQGNPELTFKLAEPQVFALAYQPYSSRSSVQAQVSLDGEPVHISVHPPGTYTTSSVVLPLAAGSHRLSWRLKCGDQVCAPDSVWLYQLTGQLRPPWQAQDKVNFYGLNTNLLVTQPPSARLADWEYDGGSLYRTLQAPVTFKVAADQRPLSLVLHASAPQATRLEIREEGRVVKSVSIPAETYRVLSVPLTRPEGAQAVQVAALCQAEASACSPARLYSAQLVTQTQGPGGRAEQLGALGLAAMLLLGLLWLLRLLPLAKR